METFRRRSIYVGSVPVPSVHSLYLMKLFRVDRNAIKEHCQSEVLTGEIHPRLRDSMWEKALEKKKSDPTKVCNGKSIKSMNLIPLLTILELPMGCLSIISLSYH